MKKAVQILNPNSRGTLAKQLNNIVKAMKNNKIGPLVLTNSIQVYLDYHLLLITKQTSHGLKPAFKDFKTFSYDEFHNLVIDYIHLAKFHFDFPFIVVIKGHWLERRSFKLSFNSDYICPSIEEAVNYYPALRLLREWSKKRNRHKVLRLNYLTSL